MELYYKFYRPYYALAGAGKTIVRERILQERGQIMRKKRSVIAMLLCAVMVASIMAGKLPGHSVKAAWDQMTITIKVVDDAGNPVQGLMLFMESDSSPGFGDLTGFSAATDANGITTYNGLDGGDYIFGGDYYYMQPVEGSGYTCDDPMEVVFDDDDGTPGVVGNIDPYDGSTVVLTVKSSGANKTALDSAISKAKALKAEDYTADSYAAVRQALVDAEAVKANAQATQDEVDAKTKALNDAVSALVRVAKTDWEEFTIKAVEEIDGQEVPVEGLSLVMADLSDSTGNGNFNFSKPTDADGKVVYKTGGLKGREKDDAEYEVKLSAVNEYDYADPANPIKATFRRTGVEIYVQTINGQPYTTGEEVVLKVAKKGGNGPQVVEGAKGIWVGGSKEGLAFRSSAAVTRVLVDGKELKAASYTKAEGDAVITLNADYLATLLAGVHTLGLETAQGTAETTFTVAIDPTDIPAYNDIDAYQYKDFSEKETVAVPALDVKETDGSTATDPIKFVIFNSTLQKVESRVTSAGGKLPAMDLIKNHNYTIYTEDENYTMDNHLYVWVRANGDGTAGIVDIKDTDIKWLIPGKEIETTTYKYPAVDSIQVKKRTAPVTDPAEDRRYTMPLEVVTENLRLLEGVDVELVSEFETVKATSDRNGKIYVHLLEDVNYVVTVKSDIWDVLSFPLVVKDKSEFTAPKLTYDHSNCHGVNQIRVVGKGEAHKYDTIITSFSGRTRVTGFNFNDILLMERELDKSLVTGLDGKDYEVLEITTINPHRWEICKLPVGEFKITETLTEGKGVEEVYYIDAEGSLQPLTFEQRGKEVSFMMTSMAMYPIVLVYNEEGAPEYDGQTMEITAIDESNRPVQNLDLYLKPTKGTDNLAFGKATDISGKSAYTVSGKEADGGVYEVQIEEANNYAYADPANPIKVTFGKDADGKLGVSMVNGAEYAGEEIFLTVTKTGPVIIEGANSAWKAGSKEGLVFRSDAEFKDFIRVLLDGKELDPKHYTVTEGSTIVTVSADYLATLPEGRHTIAIESTTGVATTAFTVEGEGEPEPGTPADPKPGTPGDPTPGTPKPEPGTSEDPTADGGSTGAGGKNGGSGAPQTGDAAPIGGYGALMIAAAAVIAAELKRRSVR